MAEKTSMNLEENVAGLLCYLVMWVTGIIFILLEKKNKTVRFHAMQSILIFLPLNIIAGIFSWIGTPHFSWQSGWHGGNEIALWIYYIILVITFVLWLVLMIKAYQGEKFKLPVIGDIAEKHS